jgi:hypothetical protein
MDVIKIVQPVDKSQSKSVLKECEKFDLIRSRSLRKRRTATRNDLRDVRIASDHQERRGNEVRSGKGTL